MRAHGIRTLWLVVVFAAASPIAAAQQSTSAPALKALVGTVVDAGGKPVSGAAVSGYWIANDLGDYFPGLLARSRGDGGFSIPNIFDNRPVALMAIDADQESGGITVLDAEHAEKRLTITLEPLVEVRGKIAAPAERKDPPDLLRLMVGHAVSGQWLIQCASSDSEFTLKLPPGSFRLLVRAAEMVPAGKQIEIARGAKPLDLGTINLELTPIAKHKGKEPPAWNVTDARGAPSSVKLSDFKGKWVVVEFWGYW